MSKTVGGAGRPRRHSAVKDGQAGSRQDKKLTYTLQESASTECHNGRDSGRAGQPRRHSAVKYSQTGRRQAFTRGDMRALQRRAARNQNRQPAAVVNTDH